MSTAPRIPRMSREEYLKYELTAEIRHEFYRGELFAMPGGTSAHSRLKVQLVSLLNRETKKVNCTTFDADMRIRIESTGLYTYPDASVVCDKPMFENERKNTLLNPRALFEVLSPSTEAYDRGTKFAHYQKLDSLRNYVLISSMQQRVEVFRKRDDAGWAFDSYETSSEIVELPSIRCSLSIGELYDGVELSQDIDRRSVSLYRDSAEPDEQE